MPGGSVTGTAPRVRVGLTGRSTTIQASHLTAEASAVQTDSLSAVADSTEGMTERAAATLLAGENSRGL